MSLLFVAQMIGLIANVLTILVFVWVILSWIMPPYHPLREALDRVVEPMLAPIRHVLPAMGGVDFSPMILIIAIEIAASILSRLILTLAIR
jgi:YggT family protein